MTAPSTARRTLDNPAETDQPAVPAGRLPRQRPTTESRPAPWDDFHNAGPDVFWADRDEPTTGN